MVVRRKLADISNLPQQSRPLIRDEKSLCTSTTAKEHIEQLQKENMALVKMLAQRNKIIEQSGIQLEKMKVNLIKVQGQNHQLALANTQMLADINSGKEKLKALQHELGCKNVLLNLRKLELKEKDKSTCNQVADAKINSPKILEEVGEPSKECKEVEKPPTSKRKLNEHSLNPCLFIQSENTTNKRPSTRRQSARFKAAESKSSEESHETSNSISPKCPLPDNPIPEDTSTSSNASIEIEERKFSSSVDCESQGSQRLSLSRPSRMVVKKVQSYKEIPLNVKMRRPE